MESGRLRYLVSVQKDQGTIRGPDGAHLPDWHVLAVVAARITPLRGEEGWYAREAYSEVTHEVELRYCAALADLSGSVRVVFGTRVFHLKNSLNVEERGRSLLLHVTEAPDSRQYQGILDPAGDVILDLAGGVLEEP